MKNKLKKLVVSVYKSLVENALNSGKKRDIILFADHFIEPLSIPQDNFYMFEYMLERQSEGVRPYYIMNENSSLFAEAGKKYGDRIIGYGKDSLFKLKIFKYLRKTKIVCDSYQVMNHVVPGFTSAAKNSPNIFTVFTQHGVNFFKESFIETKSFSSFMFDKTVVSNDYEKNIFLGRGKFLPKNIIENGLCRWDFIKPQYGNKTIFLFFTHRRYLSAIDDIKNSRYYKTIKNLIETLKNNPTVSAGGFKIKIALHHSVLDRFGYELMEGIEIVREEDIEKVKSKSDILITDYSSMCFEMWFQRKPVIFLRIDDGEECRRYGNITDLPEPYRSTGEYICNISDSVDECIGIFESYAESGFKFTEREEEIRSFFFYYDSDFRERFYNYLIELSKEEKRCFLPIGKEILFKDYSDIFVKGLDFPDENGRRLTGKKAAVAFSAEEKGEGLSVRLKCRSETDKGKEFNVRFSAAGGSTVEERFTGGIEKEVVLKIEKNDGNVRIYITADDKISLISIMLLK